MKNIFTYCIFFLLPAFGFSQRTVPLFNGKAEIHLPVLLVREEQSGGKPDYLFQSKKHPATLSVSELDYEISDNDIPAYADSVIADLKKSNAGVKIIDDGISLNAGKNISYVKYTTDAKPASFIYKFYGSMYNHLVVFNFDCPKKDLSLWEDEMDNVVENLRINDIIY